MSEKKNRKVAKTEKEEFKWPRLVISICFVVLMITYIFLLTTKTTKYNSIASIIIALTAGALLITFGIVIKLQERKVDLDYDSAVTWKLCVVVGVIIAGFGLFCIFI